MGCSISKYDATSHSTSGTGNEEPNAKNKTDKAESRIKRLLSGHKFTDRHLLFWKKDEVKASSSHIEMKPQAVNSDEQPKLLPMNPRWEKIRDATDAKEFERLVYREVREHIWGMFYDGRTIDAIDPCVIDSCYTLASVIADKAKEIETEKNRAEMSNLSPFEIGRIEEKLKVYSLMHGYVLSKQALLNVLLMNKEQAATLYLGAFDAARKHINDRTVDWLIQSVDYCRTWKQIKKVHSYLQYALEKINSGETEENITDENKDKLIRCEFFQREFISKHVKEEIDFLQKTLVKEKNKLKNDPENFDLKIEIGKTCYTLGYKYQDQKNAKDSLIFFQESLSIFDGLLKKDKKSMELHERTAVSSDEMAFAHGEQNSYRDSVFYYKKSLHLWEKMLKKEPDSIFLLEKICRCTIGIGFGSYQIEKKADAKYYLSKSVKLAESIVKKDQSNETYKALLNEAKESLHFINS